MDRKFVGLRGRNVGGQVLDLFGHSCDAPQTSLTQAVVGRFSGAPSDDGAACV